MHFEIRDDGLHLPREIGKFNTISFRPRTRYNEEHRFAIRTVPNAVWLAGQNFQSFEFLKSLGQPRLFNRQFAFHYEKELPSVAMVVRDFRASRRHPFP